MITPFDMGYEFGLIRRRERLNGLLKTSNDPMVHEDCMSGHQKDEAGLAGLGGRLDDSACETQGTG